MTILIPGMDGNFGANDGEYKDYEKVTLLLKKQQDIIDQLAAATTNMIYAIKRLEERITLLEGDYAGPKG